MWPLRDAVWIYGDSPTLDLHPVMVPPGPGPRAEPASSSSGPFRVRWGNLRGHLPPSDLPAIPVAPNAEEESETDYYESDIDSTISSTSEMAQS